MSRARVSVLLTRMVGNVARPRVPGGFKRTFSDVGPHANTRVADAGPIRPGPACANNAAAVQDAIVSKVRQKILRQQPCMLGDWCAIPVAVSPESCGCYGVWLPENARASDTPIASRRTLDRGGACVRHRAPDLYSSCSSIFLLEEFDPSVSGLRD